MATLATYLDLKTAISSYFDYGDQSITDNIPLFIKITEDELATMVRLPSMEQTIFTDVITDDLVRLPIPIDYIELKRIYYPDTFETIDLIDLEMMPREKYNYSDISSDARPISMCRDGSFWYLNRAAINGTRIQITYFATPSQMTIDADQSVFLRDMGQVMLYRCVAEAHRFLENMEMADYFLNLAQTDLVTIQGQANSAENSGSVIAQSSYPW